MSFEEFAKLFDGYTEEQIGSVLEFIKLYHKADTDTRKAIGEVLEVLNDSQTMADAINRISNEDTRARWIEHAKEAGVYDNPIEKTA